MDSKARSRRVRRGVNRTTKAAQDKGRKFVDDFLTRLSLIDAEVQDSVRKQLR